MANMTNCPVCNLFGVKAAPSNGDSTHYQCERCGRYTLSGTAEGLLEAKKELEPLLGPALSFNIRKNQRQEKRPFISNEIIEALEKDPFLPGPVEQAENFLLWLAEQSQTPGVRIEADSSNISSILGARDIDGVDFIIRSLDERGLVNAHRYKGGAVTELSFDGWEYVDQLQRMSREGSKAFMAMAFGNPELEEVLENHFKPAVQAAGFSLFRLDDQPEAGSIDERLRVEIRRSAFVIADLSDENLGAYWEAGFAEGLGKPVIYTCEKEFFDGKGTHFDTSHLHTVLWNKAAPKEAGEELKATIRATLPHVAKMEDS